MPKYVHVARILPGQKDEFLAGIKRGFEAGREGLKSFGFKHITSFFSPEVASESDGVLVTIYEADDPAVIERFYQMEAVIKQEEQAHGRLVAAHNHDAVPKNEAFLDLDLRS